MFRWAVIGTGNIANKVMKEITKTKRHTVSAVFSRTKEKAEIFAKTYGGIVFDTAEELLQKGEFDGVYVATPHSEHYRYAKMCVNAGRPALVEKAFTVNARQAEELYRLSAEKNVYLAEAMWMRFSPIAKQVKQWVSDGALGQVTKVKAEFSFNIHIGASTDRVTLSQYAGGALLDVGVYTVSLCQMLLGDPAAIKCVSKFTDTRVDAKSIIELRYPNGAVCELKCGINGNIKNTAKVYGENGKINLPLFFAMPKAVLKSGKKKLSAKAEIGYIYQFDRVAADISAGKIMSEEVSHLDSVSVMQILDACRADCGLTFPSEIEKL